MKLISVFLFLKGKLSGHPKFEIKFWIKRGVHFWKRKGDPKMKFLEDFKNQILLFVWILLQEFP